MVVARKLVGMSVITSDAFKLGQVEGTDVDTESWKVTHLHIGLTDDAVRELSLKKPLLGGIRVCLPVSYVSKLGDVITLRTPFSEVKSAPECKAK